jgi:hypothetical protein
MFPQQVEALIKGVPSAEAKPAPAKPAAAPSPAPPVSSGARVISSQQLALSIDGRRYEVCVEKLDA